MLRLIPGACVAVVCVGLQCALGQERRVDANQDARAALERARAHYMGLKGFRVTVTSKFTIGEEDSHGQEFVVAAEKPNRLSIKAEAEGELQYAIVSDGERLWQYYGGFVSKYEKSAAPASMAELMKAVSMGREVEASTFLMSPHLLPMVLLDDELFGELGKGELTMVGREEVHGRAHDRISITMDGKKADLWLAAEGEAWLARVVPDFSGMMPMLEDMPEEMEELRSRMPKVEFELSNWKAGEAGAEAFAFAPPAGAEQVDSLVEALREDWIGADEGEEEEEHADLLGKPAPEIELDLLGGGKMSLAEHRGKHVVRLDFWATWCPPCVKGLPLVAEAAAPLKDKGVVFYAVNLREPAATIQKFLDKRELQVTVALDRDGKAGEAFGVSGIPQTVLIGRDGTVQAVHVGFMQGTEVELKEQLEQLLEGKALVEAMGDHAAAPGRAAAPAKTSGTMALEERWSRAGQWVSCAVDATGGDTYALRDNGQVVRFNRDGEQLAKVKLKGGEDLRVLRLAKRGADAAPALVTFGRWGRSVTAFGQDGGKLWEYAIGDGVDDVWPADLDGDGQDELIIGYNGSTGLHALNADGSVRWKYTRIGNVWHVTAAPDENGEMQVITTSAEGMVHLFSAAGKRITNLRPGGYANMVRVAQPTQDAEQVIITTLNNGEALAAMDRSGKKLWRVDLDGHVVDGIAAPGQPCIAIVASDGRVRVFDIQDGSKLLEVKAGHSPAAAWIPGEDGPLLVIAGGSGLRVGELRAATKGGEEP